MDRIVEGVIAGVSFIGGGAILHQKDGVKGTATGAIGTAVGLDSYDVAIVLSLITLLTLWALSPPRPELVREPDGEEAREDMSARRNGDSHE
jgi:putative Mg2+ transporter-C (MgtC) family protein